MSLRNVEIHVTGPGRGTIHVDGERLRGVTGFTAAGSAKNLLRVTVDLVVQTGVIDGRAVILLGKGTAESLLKLGWTPPPVSLVKERDLMIKEREA